MRSELSTVQGGIKNATPDRITRLTVTDCGHRYSPAAPVCDDLSTATRVEKLPTTSLMFLRWKTRSKQTRQDEVTHVASLVQSIRVAGVVRQQHLAYLGSVVSTRGQFSPWAVRNFW